MYIFYLLMIFDDFKEMFAPTDARNSDKERWLAAWRSG